MPVQFPEVQLFPSCTATRNKEGPHGKPSTEDSDSPGARRAPGKACSQLTKKLSIFPGTKKINPLSVVEDRPGVGLATRGPPVVSTSTAVAEAAPVQWSNLPLNVVEIVFRQLKQRLDHEDEHSLSHGKLRNRLRACYGAYSTCKAWREAGLSVLFSYWYHATPEAITHPSQCLYLTPRVFPHLLRCFMVRSRLNGHKHFKLYQGTDPEDGNKKFLMAAEFASAGCKMYFSAAPDSSPAAVVHPSLLRKSYELRLKDHGGGIGLPGLGAAGLADITYQTRILSCLRPRRMSVLTSGANIGLPQGPLHADPPTGPSPSPSASRDASAPTELRTVPNAVRMARVSQILSRQGQSSKLQNKEPRWNESLRCWCLNFRGRVKLASVKNFQLAAEEDPDHVLLQFGKANDQHYILDFQPAALSVVQAFAVALSSFRPGLI